MKTEQEIEQEILNQVAHLRWAASQGCRVPIADVEELPTRNLHSREIQYAFSHGGYDEDANRRPPTSGGNDTFSRPSKTDRFDLYGHVKVLYEAYPQGSDFYSSKAWKDFYLKVREYFKQRNTPENIARCIAEEKAYKEKTDRIKKEIENGVF